MVMYRNLSLFAQVTRNITSVIKKLSCSEKKTPLYSCIRHSVSVSVSFASSFDRSSAKINFLIVRVVEKSDYRF